tara:strand:+ start:365 stop:907 length:543 start_codon:yes stop_codon:yes gene_type:complete
MLKIYKDTEKWEANYSSDFKDIWKANNLQARPSVINKAKDILKNRHKINTNNFGICLHKEKEGDFNIILSALNRVRASKKGARFYISTDSQNIIEKFVEASSMDLTLWDMCPVIPNFTGNDFSPEEKTIIDFLCLRAMNQTFSTPYNGYAFAAASAGRGGVYIPHEEDVFVLPKSELAKH